MHVLSPCCRHRSLCRIQPSFSLSTAPLSALPGRLSAVKHANASAFTQGPTSTTVAYTTNGNFKRPRSRRVAKSALRSYLDAGEMDALQVMSVGLGLFEESRQRPTHDLPTTIPSASSNTSTSTSASSSSSSTPTPTPTFVPVRVSGGEPARIKEAAAGGAVLTGAQAQMTKGDKGLMRTPKSPGARIAPTIAGSPSPFRGLANKKKNRMALEPL